MKRDDQNKDADDDDEEDESKLEIKLISVITVYYLVGTLNWIFQLIIEAVLHISLEYKGGIQCMKSSLFVWSLQSTIWRAASV